MALDMTKFGPGLKAYYSNQKVENMTYKDYPFYAMLTKKKDFYGKNYPLPIQIGNPQGRSHTFSKAKANQTSSVYKEDRKSTRLNSSHIQKSRMPSSA